MDSPFINLFKFESNWSLLLPNDLFIPKSGCASAEQRHLNTRTSFCGAMGSGGASDQGQLAKTWAQLGEDSE